MRGNVVDLAVGIVIGGAFGKIVSSLVGDIIMPAIGSLGKIDLSRYTIELVKAKEGTEAVRATGGRICSNNRRFFDRSSGHICSHQADEFAETQRRCGACRPAANA